jgi:hypothetical protein
MGKVMHRSFSGHRFTTAATRRTIAPRRRAAAATASLAVTAASVLTATSLLAAGPAAASTQNPQAIYKAAIAAAGDQGVHFVSHASQGGTSIDVTGDTGATSGAQSLTVHNGSVVEHLNAVLVGSIGFVKGNAAALHNIIGLTTTQSSKYTNKWLSFPTANNSLDELIGGLENKQVSSELQMNGPYTFGKATTVAGQNALAIKGSVSTESGTKVPVVLYVPATGRQLPIEEVTNPGAGKNSSTIHGTVAFSNWGEKTVEKVPPHAVSLLTLTGGS